MPVKGIGTFLGTTLQSFDNNNCDSNSNDNGEKQKIE